MNNPATMEKSVSHRAWDDMRSRAGDRTCARTSGRVWDRVYDRARGPMMLRVVIRVIGPVGEIVRDA